MENISEIKDVLHTIKVKLYPNYLKGFRGKYYARTNNESSLPIEDVCASMKKRGGYTGNYDNLVENVKQFFEEMAYLLCDGYAVNTGFFSVHPNIGGIFESPNDQHDPKKHPVSFRFRSRARFRRLLKHIRIEITGIAETSGFIDKFIDYDNNSSNVVYKPGNLFCILGNKIKIAGDDPDCGVYFVPKDDPSRAVKVTRLAENNPKKITGIIPETEFNQNSIEIRTQYTGSGNKMLKNPRIIKSHFTLQAA